MDRRGFTLTELLVTTALLTVVSLLGFYALQSSSQMTATASNTGRVQAEVRETLELLNSELQLASQDGNDSLDPPLLGVAITENPVPGSPVEIAFQTPIDGSGRRWSSRIRFRYVNEDANGNFQMDAGEDLDGDGILTRRIFRIQDLNGDGDADDPGENIPIGTATNLTNVEFESRFNGRLVTIRLEAARLPPHHGEHPPISAEVFGEVYLRN